MTHLEFDTGVSPENLARLLDENREEVEALIKTDPIFRAARNEMQPLSVSANGSNATVAPKPSKHPTPVSK